ncbi:MAG: hypothetical protein JNL24_14380 [Bacteroidia bacterium]|nr:hypothetical protein [Bacteroidia bacterium]
MYKIIFAGLFLTISTICYGQNPPNVFKTYNEFKENKPSEYVDFSIELWSAGNLTNFKRRTYYRIKKVAPLSKRKALKKEVWGVIFEGSEYINSFPYSGLCEYDYIQGKGYYTYFNGKQIDSYDMQVKLGIIKQGEKIKQLWGKSAYVILPDGTLKWLNPELLKELISDNKILLEELEAQNLKEEDVYKMFEILKRYNSTKK